MAKKNEAKITSLKLSHPFDYGGEHYNELQVKRPTADDLNDIAPGNITFGQFIDMGLKCSGLPPTATTRKLLSAKDGVALANLVSDFL